MPINLINNIKLKKYHRVSVKNVRFDEESLVYVESKLYIVSGKIEKKIEVFM